MDTIKELQGLKRDAFSLRRNIMGEGFAHGCVVFIYRDAARKQIRRILGRTWALKGEKNWNAVNDAAVELFLFAVEDWSMLGSYSPEDWPLIREDIRGIAQRLIEWTERRVQEGHSSPSSLP
jgi:hypothetical protein